MFKITGTPVMALLAGVLVFLSKLPWVFTTLGEQDHGRFILAAMIYAQDGSQTIRPYAMLTSPLWTLPLSLLSHWLRAPQLVLVSNVVGWSAGAAVAALSYVFLRQFSCSRAWSFVGACAATWVPGAFYTSLYGYPSQWALPFLLASGLAFLRSLDATTTSQRLRWFLVAAVCFCCLILVKVDFALAGTFLIGIAILRNKLFNNWTYCVPLIALVSGGVALLLSRLLIAQTYGEFASGWSTLYPGKVSPLADPFSVTTLYSVGVGTTLLWGAAVLVGLLRRTSRRSTAQACMAWAVAVCPLWLFWMTRPPMSSRHALPGAVLTVLFAALIAGQHLRRWPLLAPAWLIALLLMNAPFGSANFDFNYRPSGNLPLGARLNRRAFAVGMKIADAITERPERTKALIGAPEQRVLGGIDILPLVEFSMAARSANVRCVGQISDNTDPHTRDIVFTSPDGRETNLLRYVEPKRVGFYRGKDVGFYAPWGLQGATVNVVGVEVVEFDPQAIHDTLFGATTAP